MNSRKNQTFTIRLLGPLEVLQNTDHIEISQKKARALLAYLARRRQKAARDSLAGLLWSDSPEEQARASLRQSLSALRKALGDAVEADGEFVGLADSVSIDVSSFEGLREAEDQATLVDADIAYRGEFLEGFPSITPEFDRWLDAERSALRATHIAALLKLCEMHEGENAVDELVAIATRLLALDPLQEHVHRLLIRAYGKQKRYDAALKQYDRLVDILESELGVRPEPPTTALITEVRKARSGTAPVYSAPAKHERSLPKKPSIAVLPFRSASGDADAQFFAEGVAEDVIVELSREPDLLVIARESSFRFDGGQPLSEVGTALGVRFLVTGSVRRAGDRVRVTAGLSRAETGEEIWADRYDRDLTDIFDIQTEIARTVTSTVIGRIDEAERQAASGSSFERLEANQLVLYGLKHMNAITHTDMLKAIEYFTRATKTDPAYARGWGLLGLATLYERWYYHIDLAFETAVEHAETAISLDPGEAKAHCTIGMNHLMAERFDPARYHLETALKRFPNDDLLAIEYGRFLMYDDRADEGLMRIREAMRLNPYHPNWYWNIVGRNLHTLERYDEALECFLKVLNPPFYVHGYRAACFLRLGDTEHADEAKDIFWRERPDFDLEALLAIMPYRNPSQKDMIRRDFTDAVIARR